MTTPNLRTVSRVSVAHRQEEGGGFIVRRPFPARGLLDIDPFLLLDEMGPVTYGPGEALGAPDHPHRGFETVTYLLEGEMEHEDSAGHRGKLAPGDVQWMTAGAGVVHSELPSASVRERGGRVHGFQLWVNLPARDKMMPPRYQELPASGIPSAASGDGLARVKVLAGEALGVKARIDTRTPILYQHWTLQPGARVTQAVDPAFRAFAYTFAGEARVAERAIPEGTIAVLGHGDAVELANRTDAPAELLLLGGTPLNEPVARYGPFVMNTEDEIVQAVHDFQSGKLGRIAR